MTLSGITDSVFVASIVVIPLMLRIRGVPLRSLFECPPAATADAKDRSYARFRSFQMVFGILIVAALCAMITDIRILGKRPGVYLHMLIVAGIWTQALFVVTAAQRNGT